MAEKRLGESMGRGDFFKWGFQSIKEKTMETALNSLNNISSVVALTEEKWEKVALLEQLSERPKSIFLKTKSFYLVASTNTQVKAYRAICPIDGKPLQWQEHLQRFHCIQCSSSFDREGQILESQTNSKMQECRVKCEEGNVYINL